jgi:cyclin B
MENSILNKISWNLTVPTPYVFLVQFTNDAGSDKESWSTRRSSSPKWR